MCLKAIFRNVSLRKAQHAGIVNENIESFLLWKLKPSFRYIQYVTIIIILYIPDLFPYTLSLAISEQLKNFVQLIL